MRRIEPHDLCAAALAGGMDMRQVSRIYFVLSNQINLLQIVLNQNR